MYTTFFSSSFPALIHVIFLLIQVDTKKGADAGKDWRKGKPLRVVRNFKGRKHSPYAPEDGNRYDGIYKVVKVNNTFTCFSLASIHFIYFIHFIHISPEFLCHKRIDFYIHSWHNAMFICFLKVLVWGREIGFHVLVLQNAEIFNTNLTVVFSRISRFGEAYSSIFQQ